VAPVFVVSPRAAVFLAASDLAVFRGLGLTGGTIGGVPALASPAAAANLILIDAAQLAVADDGLDVALGRHVAIEMSDGPSMSSAAPTAVSVVSAWQAGAAALKLTRYLSWALLRDDAVGHLALPIGGSPA
jgi:hypothetical protein